MAKSEKSESPKLPACTLAELMAQGPMTIVALTPQGQIVLGTASPRLFSTGSYGYNLNGKANVTVNNKGVKLQLSCNLTVVNSKDAPAEMKVLAAGTPEPAKTEEAA